MSDTSILKYNDENSLIFLPRKNGDLPALVVELKIQINTECFHFIFINKVSYCHKSYTNADYN